MKRAELIAVAVMGMLFAAVWTAAVVGGGIAIYCETTSGDKVVCPSYPARGYFIKGPWRQ